MKKVLLFDIDGTLLSVDHQWMRSMLVGILESMSLDPDLVNQVSYSGRTDTAIFRDLLGDRSDQEQLFAQLKNKYTKRLQTALTKDSVTVFDGALETIRYAEKNNLTIGLCTGNFRETAYIKLKAAGLAHLFPFGGFGCNHADRNYLPELARSDYEVYSGMPGRNSDFIVIGDTPNDITSAKHFGGRSVAVATGNYSYEELQKHSPDLVLPTLRNPGNWLSGLI